MEEYSYSDKSKKPKNAIAINIVLTAIILILLVLIILFSTILTTMTVSGNSMCPTLNHGDRLIILKHGYKLERGDIIVFKRENAYNVKRILGLEGDIIKFDLENMTWVVNGKAYEEKYVDDYSDNYFNMSDSDILKAIFSEKGLTVEQGKLFVLGDNRNIQDNNGISVDSHIYGTLDITHVIGKVIKP